jgi:hypothetical protein
MSFKSNYRVRKRESKSVATLDWRDALTGRAVGEGSTISEK